MTTLLWPTLNDIVNVASVPQRSPFRYPGGKTWLIPQVRRWLLAKRTRPAIFIEPFAGGAIAGLTVGFEQLADRVLLVEVDPDVASVWRTVLNGHADSLAERILRFNLTVGRARSVLAHRHRTLLDRAFATILRNRVQHGGILAPGASLMRDGENGMGIKSRWYPETLARRISEISAIKDRFSFVQGDAFEVIECFRRAANVVFFVDPPYTVAGRRLYTFSEINHKRLFDLMGRVTGDFMLTYDDTPEVRRWAQDAGLEFESVVMKSRQHCRKSELIIGKDLRWANEG
ncbi:MAG: DNA adenine methylase [Phycisphaerae bacterium]|nr:DNA adenine methylase [Phycisphaerae bacterium]